ncbi:MAG: hypothetical protein K6F33_06945 [Bacteroidales bacterium]|nr:hypothetical protein [Bacteroidales bacterium]
MNGREDFLDEVDTLTEVAEDEALNPDYDRVSGSGTMPSLEDFLGVSHTADGLGEASDPFGNVIGDPSFSDYSIDSPQDDGFAAEGAEASADGETEDVEQQPFFQMLMSGNLFKSAVFVKNISFGALLVLLAILHIANRNRAESLIRDEIRLTREVQDLKSESIRIAADLMSISKVTEVSKLVKDRKLGIHPIAEPPMVFVMDKFHRVDSLITNEQESQHRYDEEFDYVLQK